MKKFLSVVMAMVLVFSLIPMNAMAVEDTNIQSIEFEDAYTLGTRETAHGREYTFSTRCTINFVDGTQEMAYVSGYWGGESNIYLSNGEVYNVEFSCRDTSLGTWALGESREYIGTIKGVSATFNVTYVEIQDIEVETVECIENWDGYESGDWDSENECYENPWFCYNIYPNNITVNLSNAESLIGSCEEISNYIGRSVYCNDNQSFENQWGIGEHTATIYVGGYEKQYTVNVVETPVQSVEIEDLVFMPGTNGTWMSENGSEQFWVYDISPKSMSVTFKDGRVVAGQYSDICGEFGMSYGPYGPGCYGDQSFNNQWGLGEHKVTFCVLGVEAEYSIKIESPIQSIEIEDVEIIECSNGYYEGENYIYHTSNIKAQVTLKDGTVKPYEGSFEIYDEWYSINTNAWELQQEESWQAGNTYEVIGTLLGVSDTFNVTIIESPVESIEIEDITLIEKTDGYYSEEDFFYSIYNLKAAVKLENEDEREIYGGLNLDDTWYSINTNEWEMQNEEPWEAGNTYEVTGTFLGASDTFNVTIVESPIESIVLEDIVLFEGVDSSDNGGWEYYDVRPVLSAVLLKNGEYADIENDWYIQYDGEYHGVSVDVGSMQYEEHWEVGRTYTVTGTLLGVSATFNVTIQENPIREIELLEMPDKTEYLVAELFNLKGATFRLWYNDNSYEDIVINEEHFGFFLEEVWSHKLNKYGWTYMQYDFQEVEQTMAEVCLFGKTCEIPITVKENLMESISIKEHDDKCIVITVKNSDNTSYDMTILDIYSEEWGTDDAIAYLLLTDRGVFEALIYDSENSFAIGFLDNYSENIIKSNSLPGSEWYEAVNCFDNFCSSILPGNDNFLSFNGQVTEDNIDRIIGTAFYMGYSWDDEDVVWEGDYATISGERIRESLAKYFALENVDLTLSESYDSQSDTYELFDYIRASWIKTRPCKINYSNGIWSVKVTYLSGDGTEMSTYLKLNDEQKIISYRVNATEMVGDTDDDGELTDWDGVVLARYLAGWNVEINSFTTVDVDGDGELTDWDGVILDRYLAGWDIQIGGDL